MYVYMYIVIKTLHHLVWHTTLMIVQLTFYSLGLQCLYVRISKEWCCNEEIHVRGIGNFEFEPVIRKLWPTFLKVN